MSFLRGEHGTILGLVLTSFLIVRLEKSFGDNFESGLHKSSMEEILLMSQPQNCKNGTKLVWLIKGSTTLHI